MDFTVLYTSSPDWIKAMMVILPHGTLLGITWLIFRRPARTLPPLVSVPSLKEPPRPPVMDMLPPSRDLPPLHERRELGGEELELVAEDRERDADPR